MQSQMKRSKWICHPYRFKVAFIENMRLYGRVNWLITQMKMPSNKCRQFALSKIKEADKTNMKKRSDLHKAGRASAQQQSMANLIESAYTRIDRRWSDCKLPFSFTYQWQTHQTHFGQMCVNLFITRSI